jgi:hypothetical protein
MTPSRIFGIVLLVVGAMLLLLGYQGSQSVMDQTKHVFTGQFRDKTTWMLLGGAIATITGLVAIAMPPRRLGTGYA